MIVWFKEFFGGNLVIKSKIKRILTASPSPSLNSQCFVSIIRKWRRRGKESRASAIMDAFVEENKIVFVKWCRICGCVCLHCRLRLPAEFRPCVCSSTKVHQNWIVLGLDRHDFNNCKVSFCRFCLRLCCFNLD